MIERFLIEHCSATLASIKAANLCNMTFSSKEELEDQISYWSACLEPKGIHIFVLREHETRALVYVYREGLLQKQRSLNCCGLSPPGKASVAMESIHSWYFGLSFNS